MAKVWKIIDGKHVLWDTETKSIVPQTLGWNAAIDFIEKSDKVIAKAEKEMAAQKKEVMDSSLKYVGNQLGNLKSAIGDRLVWGDTPGVNLATQKRIDKQSAKFAKQQKDAQKFFLGNEADQVEQKLKAIKEDKKNEVKPESKKKDSSWVDWFDPRKNQAILDQAYSKSNNPIIKSDENTANRLDQKEKIDWDAWAVGERWAKAGARQSSSKGSVARSKYLRDRKKWDAKWKSERERAADAKEKQSKTATDNALTQQTTTKAADKKDDKAFTGSTSFSDMAKDFGQSQLDKLNVVKKVKSLNPNTPQGAVNLAKAAGRFAAAFGPKDTKVTWAKNKPIIAQTSPLEDELEDIYGVWGV